MGYSPNNSLQADDAEIKSKINAAGIINATLEKLWVEVYTSMAKGKYLLWNMKLDSIWMILAGDVKEGEKEDQRIKEIDLKLYEAGSLNHPSSKGFEVIKNPNKNLQYIYLKKKSIYLRRLQNKQGKGTAYASEDEDDLN